MQSRAKMLTSTVIPLAVAAGVAGVVAAGSVVIHAANANPSASNKMSNPAAVRRSGVQLAACNPCKAKRGCNPCAAKGCNPCAAKRGCNPCAAKGCNPCAARGCNPCGGACNPCGGGAAKYSARCVIPRLKTASLCNPCAAKGCNPCAAKKGCNPCAAKGCNPCAAKRGCNPCAAKGCNPCAAKRGCNPCAAKGCNPCAARGCNPCGGACNPCGGAAQIDLTAAEAKNAYDCILKEMGQAYGKSGLWVAKTYAGWKRYSKVAYQSATHSNRFVQNYANPQGRQYGRFEKAGKMPEGAYLVKDSFTVSKDGKIGVGPLFVMRKMQAGFNAASGDWKYAMVMPNGAFFGETNGKNSKNMKFCIDCHITVAEDQDSMMFLPENLRN